MDAAEFNEMTRKAAEAVGHLSEEGRRRAAEILRQAQADLVVKLAGAPSEYNQWFYSSMQASLDDIVRDLDARYNTGLISDLDRAALLVVNAVDTPLAQAGIKVALPQVSRQTVEMLANYTPGELITGLTDAARKKISAELQAGMLGIKSPWEVQQAIAANLDGPGIFGSLQARAEAIWDTETSRVFNTLTNERFKRLAQDFPEWFPQTSPGETPPTSAGNTPRRRLLKQWVHSGNMRHPRMHHVAMAAMPPIPMAQKFLVGGYECDGPHDSVLPASETIRCRCSVRMIMEEVS